MNGAVGLNATVGSPVDKVIGSFEAAFLMLPEFVAALLVIVLSWLIAGAVRRMVRGLLEKVFIYAEVNNLLAATSKVEFFYREFGGSSVDFDIRFGVDFRRQSDHLYAQSEAIMRLKEAFDEGGITIPFPIRTLDFGVVGGEKLSEALPPTLLSGGTPQT